MPLVRRLPKRGFNNAAFNAKALAVNVSDLEKKFEAGAEITVETLAKAGFSDNKQPKIKIKILGNGELTKKFTVKVPCSARFRQGEDREGGRLRRLTLWLSSLQRNRGKLFCRGLLFGLFCKIGHGYSVVRHGIAA